MAAEPITKAPAEERPVPKTQQIVQASAPEPQPIPDESYFLAEFRQAQDDGTPSLKFRKGFDTSPWHFMFFRPEVIAAQANRMARFGWVCVTRDGGIYGHMFKHWFEKDMFDPVSGRIERKVFNREQHIIEPDDILYVRPMTARKAEQKVREEWWDKTIGKDSKMYSHEMSRTRGAEGLMRSEPMEIDPNDIGDSDIY